MTQILNLTSDVGISFSDAEFTPYRKKPTIAIRQGNTSTKIATFNNQETFEWFLELLDGIYGVKEQSNEVNRN